MWRGWQPSPTGRERVTSPKPLYCKENSNNLQAKLLHGNILLSCERGFNSVDDSFDSVLLDFDFIDCFEKIDGDIYISKFTLYLE
jgi:hypothetical protein